MSEIYTTETILRYLDGEMGGDELAAFEAGLASNASLRDEVSQLKAAIGAVQLAGAESRVRQIHQEMRMKPGKAKTVSMFPRMFLRVAAAAAILLTMAAGWFYAISSTDNIIDDHFVSYRVDASRSGGKLTSLQEAYGKGQFGAVVNDPKPENAQDSLLVALAYYNTGNYDRAGKLLLAMQGSGMFAADADYYLGFTYLAEGKRGQALQIFRKIHDDPNHLYHASVTDNMLRKLEFRNR